MLANETFSSSSSDVSKSRSASESISDSDLEETPFSNYFEDCEPVATEEERAEYERRIEEEDEQQAMLNKHFEGEDVVFSWYVRKDSSSFYIVDSNICYHNF
jgi:hypothetical protein